MDSSSSHSQRVWQRMLSGRRLSLTEPAFTDIEASDIALGLSRIARWNGQTLGKYPYTVAQHSILVDDLLQKLKPRIVTKWRLAALLHDASEYVTGDIISPFKNIMGHAYHHTEDAVSQAIFRRFSLPFPLPPPINALIHKADKQSAFLEAIHLAGFSEEDARQFIFPKASKTLLKKYPKILPEPPEKIKKDFLLRLHLCGATP